MQLRAIVSQWNIANDPIAQTDRAIGFIYVLFRAAQTIQMLVVISIPLRYCSHRYVVFAVAGVLVLESLWVVGTIARTARYGGPSMAYMEAGTVVLAMITIAVDTPADVRANSVNWLFAIASAVTVGTTIALPLAQLIILVPTIAFLYAYLSIAMGTQSFPVIFNVGGITAFPVMALICYVGIRFVRHLGVRLAASEERQVASAKLAARYEERERHGYFLHDSVIQVLEQVSSRLEARQDDAESHADLAAESRRAARQCRIYLDGRDPLEVQSLDILLAELEEHARSIQLHLYVVDERAGQHSYASAELLTVLNVAAREALRNARKHGLATTMNLRITSQDQSIVMAVTQSGEGFSPDLIGGASGMANAYYAKLWQAGGCVNIDTAPRPDYGVRVRLTIPTTELA